MKYRISMATSVAALAFFSAPAIAAHAAPCEARPVVKEFFQALNAGDLERLDGLFAEKGAGWKWYSVSDRAGRRIAPDSIQRRSLTTYFAARIRQHEELRLLRLVENGNGNFSLVLVRRADDLHGGRPVQRVGKGWVSCATGKIGVWSLGGAPAPASFGKCPRDALPVATGDLRAARVAVLRFVRNTYSEMSPSLDVRGARVTRVRPALDNPAGRAARVHCGRAVQRRTLVVEVRFPRTVPSERRSTAAFYVSRTQRGRLVWFSIA